MRKLLLFFVSLSLLLGAIPLGAHFCSDSGSMRLCQAHCPDEGDQSHESPGHARDEASHGGNCCAQAQAMPALSPLYVTFARALEGFRLAEISVESVYLTPARDVFHPPA